MSVWEWVVVGLSAALVLAIFILVIRALLFRLKKETILPTEPLTIDPSKSVKALQALVQCETVSYLDKSKEKEEEFARLDGVLLAFYPKVFERCDAKKLSPRVWIFHLEGKNKDKKNAAVFTAHFDVVPAEPSRWVEPPFSGTIKDQILYGRGTIDTKGTLNGVLEAAEQLLENGFVPEHDFYFCFAGDEEISTGSATLSVNYLRSEGVDPLFVLDEGGAVVDGAFPGVKKTTALIGIAEKGVCAIEFHLDGEGGHASAPMPHTPVGKLARLAVRIENHPFSFRWSKPVQALFDTLGREASFGYKLLYANAHFFSPILDLVTRKNGGQLNALFRTTAALTMMEGSPATNVIPSKAMIGVNIRINPSETVESVQARMNKFAQKEHLSEKPKILFAWNPSPISDTTGEGYEKIKSAIKGTWGDQTVVSPYLMTACADAHLYNAISNKVYRFSPIHLSSEELELIHGDNERLSEKQIGETVLFYYRLMKSL